MEMNQNQIMELLDALYEKSINGIPKLSQPIDVLANDYLSKNNSTEKAARQFVNYQVAKCTTSGFVTGLGGLITLPVAIPANVSSVMYVQMRMIACLAYMGGYDTSSDQVQTLVYACLAGISIDQIIKQAGIKFGTKFTTAMVKKIPSTVFQVLISVQIIPVQSEHLTILVCLIKALLVLVRGQKEHWHIPGS